MKESEKQGRQLNAKKVYAAPELKEWGTVADLTRTGNTWESGDAKTGELGLLGSVTHSNGQ